jgi:hypothetical protein
MTSVGFTGSRQGMTEDQLRTVRNWLLMLPDGPFHHGDCVGADAEADTLAKQTMRPVIIHPPTNNRFRAFCTNARETREAQPYLQRNGAIVRECDVLIATPRTDAEQRRSGTWSTIRYARKLSKPILLISPSGGWAAEHLGRRIDMPALHQLLRDA